MQESEEAHKSAPIMPSFDTDTRESSSATSLVSWLLIFLLKLQTRYFIPDAALKLLIKFFSIFFTVLGQFSPFIKTIKNFFPKSLYDVKNYVNLNNSFRKYVICPKCKVIYSYSDAKITVRTEEESKLCTNVLYPDHPYSSRRNPCHAVLMKTVILSSGRKHFILTVYIAIKACKNLCSVFCYVPTFILTASCGEQSW